jgi:hypothetical protein
VVTPIAMPASVILCSNSLCAWSMAWANWSHTEASLVQARYAVDSGARPPGSASFQILPQKSAIAVTAPLVLTSVIAWTWRYRLTPRLLMSVAAARNAFAASRSRS